MPELAATVLWFDAGAGVAGDMLLGALLDAGASLARVRQQVAAVLGDDLDVEVTEVQRAGLRASKATVIANVPDPPHRSWAQVRGLLEDAALDPAVQRDALAVFTRLAAAEAAVHGVDADEVHFHEVGALDAIGDVVGVCAAVRDLGPLSLTVSPLALGSGSVSSGHGMLPVPVPAVLELGGGGR